MEELKYYAEIMKILNGWEDDERKHHAGIDAAGKRLRERLAQVRDYAAVARKEVQEERALHKEEK